MTLLRVARAEPAALGIHLLEFRDPAGGRLAPFTAGAHVVVTSPNGSQRKYSLCNAPSEDDHYVIAVKRDASGRGGSVDLVDRARAGDLLDVSEPHNAFELEARAPGYVFIAGGIGITPLMAMARHARNAGKRFHLYYCTRSPEATAFGAELRAEEFAGKVTLHHDHGDPERALDLWPLLERPTRDHVYCCGPRSMLESVRDMTGHWPASAIHFESFVDAAAAALPGDQAFTVVLEQSGARIEVPPGVSILEAMRARGFDAPSSCESGTCGTCKTRLVAGIADHRDLVLAGHERADRIMLCVSRALTPEIAIDR